MKDFWKNLEATLGFDPALLLLGLALVIIVVSLYLSKRGRISVFANYTDILFTVLTLVLPLGILLVFSTNSRPDPVRDNMPILALGVFVVLFLLVLKATLSYNQGFIGFLLAMFSKFVLVACLILALAVMLASKSGSTRRKYETQKAFDLRRKKETDYTGLVAGGVAAGGLILAMYFFGLRSAGFVSLSDYFSGRPRS